MLRLYLRLSRRRRFPDLHRHFCSSSSTSPSPSPHSLSSDRHARPSSVLNVSSSSSSSSSSLSPLSPSSSSSRAAICGLLALTGAAGASYLVYSDDDRYRLFSAFERALDRSKESATRISDRMMQTAAAASVLWQSLRSVLSSANYGVRSGFEFRVAAFLADIAAANSARRAAIIAAGGGKVVDWLLETVAREVSGTQAEAARALAYLIADPIVRKDVFGRPHAVPYLLQFIFSSQPHRSKKVSFFSDMLFS